MERDSYAVTAVQNPLTSLTDDVATTKRVINVFAKDVSAVEASVMAATQKPIASVAFDQVVNRAAWKIIPSWYLVAQDDRAINPELERFMADRICAKTTEIRSSHVPFLS